LFSLGLWLGLPACIEEFDILAKDFFKASGDDRKTVHQTALDKAAAIENENEKGRALFYAKTMEKIIENGYDFLKTELERVTKLSEGKLSESKKKQLNDRVNILTSFKLRLKDEL
jgi:endoplasmic reticulum protein 29